MSDASVEAPVESPPDRLLYRMFRYPWFDVPFMYRANCAIAGCDYNTGKRPVHSQALKSVLDHLGAKHDILFR